MADNVVTFPGVTKLRLDPRQVLDRVPEMEDVVVIGITEKGDFYFASSHPDGGTVLYLTERARHVLMKLVDEIEEEKR
jgi:hypothetical protein